MFVAVEMVWMYVRMWADRRFEMDERGSVVEKVILTAVFAALALAVGAIIVAKVTDKANSIDLN